MEFSPGLISVIIPAYNRAAIITEALDSVWDQTYRPIEVIVVDDGSVDDTQEVIAAWQCRHKTPDFEVRYFSRAHHGVASARNLGLQETRGEYIQFLDSDDLIIPDNLTTQEGALRRDSVDYIFGVSAIINQKGKIKLSVPRPSYNNYKGAKPWYSANVWLMSSPLFHRKVCETAGLFDERLSAAEDQEYFARIKVKDYSFQFENKVNTLIRNLAIEKSTKPMTRADKAIYARSFLLACDTIKSSLIQADKLSSREAFFLSWYYLTGSVRFGRIGLKAEALHCLQESGNLWSRHLIWTHKFIFKTAHALSAQGVAFLSRLLSIALRISRHNYFP